MKQVFYLLIGFLCITNMYAQHDVAAIEYNNKIVNEQTKIGEAILSFSSNPNAFSLAKLKEQAESSMSIIKKMKAYKDDKQLLSAAKDMFKFYISISKNDYKELLYLVENKEKYESNELTRKLNTLVKNISAKEIPLDNAFQSAQKKFAEKYGFTLQKNDLSDKLKDATKEN